MHPDRQHDRLPASATGGPSSASDNPGQRGSRSPRARRSRAAASDQDSWIHSRDGQVALERALQELEYGRVQHLDHADFLDAFDIAWLPARVAWTVTDEFTRRYERLRGRSRRAVGAALTAFVHDLAHARPHAALRSRTGLQIRRLPIDGPAPQAWSLAWSSAGRAAYLIEWRTSDAGPVAHVTWLAIGPHGAPDRRRWRGSA